MYFNKQVDQPPNGLRDIFDALGNNDNSLYLIVPMKIAILHFFRLMVTHKGLEEILV